MGHLWRSCPSLKKSPPDSGPTDLLSFFPTNKSSLSKDAKNGKYSQSLSLFEDVSEAMIDDIDVLVGAPVSGCESGHIMDGPCSVVSPINPPAVGTSEPPHTSPFYPFAPSADHVNRTWDEPSPLTPVVAPASANLTDYFPASPSIASMSPVVPVLTSLVDFPPLPTAPTSPLYPHLPVVLSHPLPS